MIPLLMLVLGTSVATAKAPDCGTPAAPAAPVQIGLSTQGRQVAGLGIAGIDDAAWSLTLLAPAGFELFTISGPPSTVSTGLDAWRPWLEKLPVERDLRLMLTPAAPAEPDRARAETCRAPGGRIRATPTATGWERRWRGAGGGARAERNGGRVTLVDPRRGYTLTLILPADQPPEGPDAAR